MKKVIMTLGTVLTMSGLLAGCGANNAAYNRPTAPRNVNYQTGYNYPYNNPNAVPAPNYTGYNNNQVNQMSYQDERDLAKRIANRADSVSGVKKAHVLVNGNTVVVGAIPESGVTDKANLRKKVRLAVLPLAGNRQVLVSTDKRYLKRITATETTFNAGKATREARSDVVGIINDLSKALKRPFQNNTK
ncbi:YhcN/YlaJ family sporulation lipoprotein [Sporolactobacillus laevolacticus]|uniref:Sporulation protein n=1 Tax=Sporolactobacillus laevolacticus DSM 442 TaxID=1395513 RepID=V6JA87_9BACL|nr:YhcN/YlaJ family sporulation lipoprotein [Sporolactobacillus laevolacticus]EST13679.1 hypothetical protein P343_01270 [Sporolactobacillus laevolacticus DSM 442]MDN3955499.1 YhcN/YlaJ family sporulation lipoprotein [Sporolactobacillus laevolacticus]